METVSKSELSKVRVAVLIPTYKEAGAIGALLDELESIFKNSPKYAWSVVVIDANSPDQTAEIVQAKTVQYKNISLIKEGAKHGIAVAYIAGINYARHILQADVFIEFDGDGQHNPHDIPRLVAEIEKGFDYVIGSRYIPDGSIPQEWSWYRKFLSHFGGLYARILLELPVHDVTSGFKASRVVGPTSSLSLSRDQLLSPDYAYKIQFLHEMVAAKARIKEIPIVFRLREHDASKSSLRDIIDSLRVTAILRLRNLRDWRLPRVILIGGVGFLLQTAVFYTVGIASGMVRPSTALIIGGEVAILSNFFLNEHLSFGDRKGRTGSFSFRILRFHLVSAGSIIIQWTLVRGAEALFGTRSPLLWAAYVLGLGLGLIANYIGYYFWVWQE